MTPTASRSPSPAASWPSAPRARPASPRSSSRARASRSTSASTPSASRAFALYKLLDLGDHIGVSGYLFRTRTGELTVHVEQLTFLSKAMLALPEKYHGLADVELRYRQRYVDLFANLDSREVFVKRAKVLRALRDVL